MESHKSIVIHSLLVALALASANLCLANKTTSLPSISTSTISSINASPSSPLFTPPSNEDEANGDDGASIRKDNESIDKALESNKTLKDNHSFYQPEYIKDPERAMSYWVDFSKLSPNQRQSSKHDLLSKSYRRAAPLRLSFDFPYYGQPLRNIIVATGGFLYLGEHLHHWLAATQNIAPLMANFDLSTSNTSDVYHFDNGTALVVQWQDVQMRDNKPPGNFSFQVTLHKNGDIVFVYKSVPVSIDKIPENEHPVKVGISDAFLIDRSAYFIRRKTIYDYHRLNMKDVPDIKSQFAIYLKALPTCNQYDSCESCSKATPNLDCVWCPAVKRCSNGYDRKRQEWLTNGCDKIQKSDCTGKPDSSSSPAQHFAAPSSAQLSVDVNPNANLTPDRNSESRSATEGGTAFVTLLMFVALTSGIAFWAFYAYRNPHTPSGQMLIKYRPSNWRWQNAETRYTAASIHM